MDGLISMLSHQVHVKWVQDPGGTHWMIISMIEIGARYRLLVTYILFIYMVFHMLTYEITGPSFLEKAHAALKGREEYIDAFLEFNAALPAPSTRAWTTLCQEWEKDRSKTNPFVTPQLRTSLLFFQDQHSDIHFIF